MVGGDGLLSGGLTSNPHLAVGTSREQCPFLKSSASAKKVIYSFIEISLFICRYNTLPSRRTLKNSRLVSKKDDVHVCIMCLRAIMNYQVCFCL